MSRSVTSSDVVISWSPWAAAIASTAALMVLSPRAVTATAESPRVSVSGETLSGEWASPRAGVAVFRGIPFAAPPISELRWRAPQPPQPRSGPQSAQQFAPACAQGPHIVDWYARVAEAFGHGPEVVGKPTGVSEDCLYLNIWTPTLDPDRKLPVMIWFHGGSNVGGWSYEPNYLGHALAARDVVVVTAAYRLGPFGFLSHPGLAASADGEPVANFGLLDQVAALRWVERHIRVFGGDPENVTSFGESAGAGNIASMIGSPLANGLRDRMILQSPGSDFMRRRSLADEQQDGIRLAAALDIGPGNSAMDRLRATSAESVMSMAAQTFADRGYEIVIDPATMSAPPLPALGADDRGRIDLLAGTNRDEWYMYLAPDTDWDDVDAWLQENAASNAAELRRRVADEADPRRALDRLITAREMRCSLYEMAGRIASLGGHAYLYHFTRQRSGAGGAQLKAYHGAEIPYVFGTHDAWLPTEPVDLELTDAMMDYWVRFATSGEPAASSQPRWPAYTQEHPVVLELGERIAAVPPPDADLCPLLTLR